MNLIRTLLHVRLVRGIAVLAVAFVAIGVVVEYQTRNDWRKPSPPATMTICVRLWASRNEFDWASRTVAQEFNMDNLGDSKSSEYGSFFVIGRGSIRCTRRADSLDDKLAVMRADAANIHDQLATNKNIAFDVRIVDDEGREYGY